MNLKDLPHNHTFIWVYIQESFYCEYLFSFLSLFTFSPLNLIFSAAIQIPHNGPRAHAQHLRCAHQLALEVDKNWWTPSSMLAMHLPPAETCCSAPTRRRHCVKTWPRTLLAMDRIFPVNTGEYIFQIYFFRGTFGKLKYKAKCRTTPGPCPKLLNEIKSNLKYGQNLTPWIWPKIEAGLKFEVKYLTEFQKKVPGLPKDGAKIT